MPDESGRMAYILWSGSTDGEEVRSPHKNEDKLWTSQSRLCIRTISSLVIDLGNKYNQQQIETGLFIVQHLGRFAPCVHPLQDTVIFWYLPCPSVELLWNRQLANPA